MNDSSWRDSLSGLEIAIVGMAGRFPGAANIEQFWQNLRDGVESISLFTDQELQSAGVDPALLKNPHYVKARPVLADIDRFDASFFGFNPREAEIVDPQQRIFLECAWETLEDAGYDPERYRGTIGVYAGAGLNFYYINNLARNPDLAGRVDPYQLFISNDKDFLATRTSYKLNLRGPSVSVQTACSTGLVALHLACRALLAGECDMALAGGTSADANQETGYYYQDGGIRSPDGHCRAFDARAQGTVFGSGVGVVLLKRLSDALVEGDHIHAIVKGSAINNDGSLKVGYTAPGLEGQAQVIRMAHAVSGVEADSIGYVETHGTATPLGDPIEIAALTQAFRATTQRKGFCAIASVKTNVGHLDTAAGTAGLIKAVLALKHKMIPPSLHFEQPNPQIDFENSPFYVNTRLQKWESAGRPRRAGVSSFGIGGTNAHIVLEETPLAEPSATSRPWQLLLLSAKTRRALDAVTANLAQHLAGHPDLCLADVAYTLQVGRQAFDYRRMAVCQDANDATSALKALCAQSSEGVQKSEGRSLAFMFTGQGAQYVNMGRGLYDVEIVFREQVDGCAEMLQPHLGLDLRSLLYPAAENLDEAAQQLDETWIAQPALFTIEYALARLWMAWGAPPQTMIGHSIGEYVAACLAGVFSLEDALALVAARGKMMQQLPQGAMLAVPLPDHEVNSLLKPELSLAAVNAPAACVVSGPVEAVEELERRLETRGTESRRLHTSHAFHSAMMDAIQKPFTERVRAVALNPPQIPYLSNLTGRWITADEATDADYWGQHLRQPVRFEEGVHELLRDPRQVLLEVGPGKTLSALARRHPERDERQVVLSSLRHPQEDKSDEAFLLETLGRLWIAGVKVNWTAFYGAEQRRRVPLPTYPFERQRYWIEARGGTSARPMPLFKNPNVAEWFYVPSWKRTVPPERQPLETGGHWLLFSTGDSLSAALARRLFEQGYEVSTVLAGEDFVASDSTYSVRPAHGDDYDALLNALEERGQSPTHVVHLWNVTPPDGDGEGHTEKALERGFYSLLYLAQAIGNKRGAEGNLQVAIVSSDVQRVTDRETVQPEKAVLYGPCRVIPQEMPNITCRAIDVELPEVGSEHEAWIVEQIIAEVEAKSPDLVVAYRGGNRWVQTYEPAPLGEAKESVPNKLRRRGVYLITGGLGGVGLALAGYLAQAVQARLVLTSRTPFPSPEARWQWLATHDPRDRTSLRIQAVNALEGLGAEVLVVQADVTDREQMEGVMRAAYARFGAIHGIIHAAGVPGGGVIQFKTAESAATVLRPKVQGTQVLKTVTRDMPLDFVVLCSSISSVTGGIGQVDYCAANAYMDALAQAGGRDANTMTVSINWDTWGEVGMAVNTPPNYTSATSIRTEKVPQLKAVNHSLLLGSRQEADGRTVYEAELTPSKHWLLAEHKVTGIPTVPGTAYLDMACAALEDCIQASQSEIREIGFAVPLMVSGNDSKEVRLILEEQGDGFGFQVVSKAGVALSGEILWQTHAMGHIKPMAARAGPEYDVEAIRARCDVSTIRTDSGRGGTAQSEGGVIEAGPRWQSLKYVAVGRNEGIAWLELDEAFSSDLAGFHLHPALLDVATELTGIASGSGRYLPLSCRNVRVYGELPRKFYSYVRYKPGSATDKETIAARVMLIDEQGRSIVDIEEFVMRRVDEEAASRPSGVEIADLQPAVGGSAQQSIAQALLTGEGIEVFRRILSRNRSSQVVVSTRHLPTLIQQGSELARPLQEQAGRAERAEHPRPELESTYVAPRDDVEERLAAIWQELLGIEQVGVFDNFFELGGDSLLALQVVSRAKQVGLGLTPQQLLQHQTIAELAEAEGSTTTQAEQGLVTGPVFLSSDQSWYLHAVTKGKSPQFNLNQSFWVGPDPNAALLEQAVQHMLIHHDVLRIRFAQDDSEWRAFIPAPDGKSPFTWIDLSTLPEPGQWAAIISHFQELQASLNLTEGPLFRVVLFNMGAHKPGFLLILAHHLIMDAFSVEIFIQDLQAAYWRFSQGKAIQLPPKTVSFKQWTEKLTRYARSPEMLQELDYWIARPWAQVPHLPVDYPEGKSNNTVASTRTLRVSLNAEETGTLLRYGTPVENMLLMSLTQAITQWTGGQWIEILVTNLGRDSIPNENADLSRTIGWFAMGGVSILRRTETSDPAEALLSVEDQLRRIPNRGLGYPMLLFLSEDEEIPKKLTSGKAELQLNYLGRIGEQKRIDGQKMDSPLFRPIPEFPGGLVQDPQNQRDLLLLFVSAAVSEGCLQIDWMYSENVHKRTTIERVANDFIGTLRALVERRKQSEDQTVARLAAQEGQITAQDEQGLVKGPVPLMPTQAWCLNSVANPNRFVVSDMFEIPRLNPELLEQAVQALLLHHDELRARFVHEESDWRQFIVEPDAKVPFALLDFSEVPAARHKEVIEFAADALQNVFNLSEGPLIQVALFDLGANRSSRLLIHMHHLVSDGYSLGILLEDLGTACLQISRGERVQLPPKTTSFKRWAERLNAYVRSEELRPERDYWLARPWTQVAPLPVDYPENRGRATIGSLRWVSAELSAEETNTLQQLLRVHGFQMLDALLMALVDTLTRWSGERKHLLNVLDSGRSVIPNARDIDLSRTVGYLAMSRILVLEREDGHPLDALRAIRDQIHRMPGRGFGITLLYNCGGTEIAERLEHCKPELLLNYLGQSGADGTSNEWVVRRAQEKTGSDQDVDEKIAQLLECVAQTKRNRLAIGLRYSEVIHKHATIERLADGLVGTLRALITHSDRATSAKAD